MLLRKSLSSLLDHGLIVSPGKALLIQFRACLLCVPWLSFYKAVCRYSLNVYSIGLSLVMPLYFLGFELVKSVAKILDWLRCCKKMRGNQLFLIQNLDLLWGFQNAEVGMFLLPIVLRPKKHLDGLRGFKLCINFLFPKISSKMSKVS